MQCNVLSMSLYLKINMKSDYAMVSAAGKSIILLFCGRDSAPPSLANCRARCTDIESRYTFVGVVTDFGVMRT